MTPSRVAGYCLAAWLWAGAAGAAPVLDQHYNANTSSFIVADRLNLAQTFTVGIGGTLTGVAVEFRNL
jgi:hypothetical protein